jgi:Sulfotransferase family
MVDVRETGESRMLVSHSHKLIFVHIQKTGGQTVSKVLKENISDISRFRRKHEFAMHAMEELEGWNEYFKFAFVRNPWDRLVSWYSMISDADAAEAHLIPVGQTEKRRLRRARRMKQRGDQLLLWRYVVDNSSTFEEFIKNCTGEIEVKPRVFYSFAYNQLEYISDTNDNLLVDYVGRFESFQKDLFEVSNRLGIELKSVPHDNRSPHRHYSSYYTPETEMIVRERFKRDIEYFGYEFEDMERRA